MRMQLGRYFSSWWTPMAATLLLLGLIVAQQAAGDFPYLAAALVGLLILSLIVVFGCGLLMLASKSFARGMANFLFFIIASMASYIFGLSSIVTSVFVLGVLLQEEDRFGQDIEIPEDMVVEWPGRRAPNPSQAAVEGAQDGEGKEMLAVLSNQTAGSSESRQISVDLTILNRFVGADRGLLLRHLASSAKWRVTERRGRIYAHRRFVTEGGRWQNSLNGFYTQYDFDPWGSRYFQVRIILAPDGPAMSQPWTDRMTDIHVGSGSMTLQLHESTNQGFESYLVVQSDGPALEIYEDTKIRARPFTALALEKIESELAALWRSDAARTNGFDPSLVPPESVNRGRPEIELVRGMQGGIYVAYGYVNPSEQGHVYLKAFEATTNQRLSAGRISERSTEHVGWSDDPDEMFFYNTEVTVYEGSWGVYYPARFELWFVPVSGGPERKLVEKIFMIEGWQR